jgi:signal peptidase I
MASVALLVTFLLSIYTSNSLAIGLSARAVKSERKRPLLLGFLVAAGFMMVNASLVVGALALSLDVAGTIVLLLTQLTIVFLVLRYTFSLSLGQTLAPFTAYLATAVLLGSVGAVLVRMLVCVSFEVTTNSMDPALERGDRIVVNRLLHPRRLDVTAYMHGGRIYCHRLVGLPGETLRFEGGKLFVNNQAVNLPPIVPPSFPARPGVEPPPALKYVEGQDILLGAHEYFLIGDMTATSLDSRMRGPTDEHQIIGVVDWRFWPIQRAAVLR